MSTKIINFRKFFHIPRNFCRQCFYKKISIKINPVSSKFRWLFFSTGFLKQKVYQASTLKDQNEAVKFSSQSQSKNVGSLPMSILQGYYYSTIKSGKHKIDLKKVGGIKNIYGAKFYIYENICNKFFTKTQNIKDSDYLNFIYLDFFSVFRIQNDKI